MLKKKTLSMAAATATAILLPLIVSASPAFAVTGDGNCRSSDYYGADLCLYYNSGFAGARFNDDNLYDNYAGYTFKAWSGGSNGAGLAVKNDAASVKNYDDQLYACLYYNSNQQGAYLRIAPLAGVELKGTALYNQNASQMFTYNGCVD